MLEQELQAAVNDYRLKWNTLAAARRDRGFFEGLQPTAVGWKTTDPADFDKRFTMLRAESDRVHLSWVDERWIAVFHLRQPLAWGISLIKLMQLRPGSNDRTGLDHIDFKAPDGTSAAVIKTSEPDLNVTDEKNGDKCHWVSVWFAETEAKLRSDTTLDVCIAEMQELNQAIDQALAVQRAGEAKRAAPKA